MHAVGPYCDVRAKFMSESNSHDIRCRHCSKARRVRDRWQYSTVRIWANIVQDPGGLDKQESSLSDPAVRWYLLLAAAGIARSMSFVAELLKVYIELNFPVGREDIRVSQGLERLAIILCLHVSFQRLEPKTLYLLSGPSPVMTGNLTLLKSELRCVCICCLTFVA